MNSEVVVMGTYNSSAILLLQWKSMNQEECFHKLARIMEVMRDEGFYVKTIDQDEPLKPQLRLLKR